MKRSFALMLCGAVAAASIVTSESRAQKPDGAARVAANAAHIAIASPLNVMSLFPVAPPAPSHPSAASPFNALVSAAAPSPIEPLSPSAAGAPRCPADMVEVEGDYCPYVQQNCVRWVDPKTQLRCAEFAAPGKCHFPTEHKKFCIDRYEWPNKPGAIPTYMTSWREAKTMCEGIGKRLCGDSEWTLACEGPEHLPYPYGLKRDSEACNIDHEYGFPDPVKVYNPETQAAELARLDRREPAGNRGRCVSSYGVHDMAGNVDEWVVNETQHGWPFKSGLKGGYWGPVRTRCRPMTTAHEETFRYYQIGFRCCAN